MQLFHCSHCGFLVFFENYQCVNCGSALAFDPEALTMRALTPALGDAGDRGLWVQRPSAVGAPPPEEGRYFRLCRHRGAQGACNFMLPRGEEDALQDLCASCRQTRVLPDLSVPDNPRRWTQIETAKRWLFYSLARLGLNRLAGETGPTYEFLADLPGAPVMTGHAQGVITLNVAEADDDERARRRLALHEPYRTLLGHLRHECGHYFWDALVLRSGEVETFRAMFGDERADYAEALRAYYARTPLQPADWQASHVSAYATAHPWEDWAETWAHYLHMVDLLETAASYQTAITLPSTALSAGLHRQPVRNPFGHPRPSFDDMVSDWGPLTLMLNSLNRSLGQQDAYPFAPSPRALDKLRFVHELITRRSAAT